jgi:hypothetical protein
MARNQSTPTPFEIEMGRALCDRLGLVHETTLREWKAESIGTDKVAVSLTTTVLMPLEDYNELRRVAAERAKGTSK